MPTVLNPPFLLLVTQVCILARLARTLAWPRNCHTDIEVGERASRIGHRNLWPRNAPHGGGDDGRDGENEDDEEDNEEEDAASYRWVWRYAI
jgi:hypothetical protein